MTGNNDYEIIKMQSCKPYKIQRQCALKMCMANSALANTGFQDDMPRFFERALRQTKKKFS